MIKHIVLLSLMTCASAQAVHAQGQVYLVGGNQVPGLVYQATPTGHVVADYVSPGRAYPYGTSVVYTNAGAYSGARAYTYGSPMVQSPATYTYGSPMIQSPVSYSYVAPAGQTPVAYNYAGRSVQLQSSYTYGSPVIQTGFGYSTAGSVATYPTNWTPGLTYYSY